MNEDKLKHIAERITTDVVLRLRFECSIIDEQTRFDEKFVLEEIVKILSGKI